MSNTWGYIVRASSVSKLADYLAGIPSVRAIDSVFGGDGITTIITYAPPFPLVYAYGDCHETEVPVNRSCDNNISAIHVASTKWKKGWPLGYGRVFCTAKGVVRNHTSYFEQCGNMTQDACCPNELPPPKFDSLVIGPGQEMGRL